MQTELRISDFLADRSNIFSVQAQVARPIGELTAKVLKSKKIKWADFFEASMRKFLAEQGVEIK